MLKGLTFVQEIFDSIGSLLQDLFKSAVNLFDASRNAAKDVSIARCDIAQGLGDSCVTANSVTV